MAEELPPQDNTIFITINKACMLGYTIINDNGRVNSWVSLMVA